MYDHDRMIVIDLYRGGDTKFSYDRHSTATTAKFVMENGFCEGQQERKIDLNELN